MLKNNKKVDKGERQQGLMGQLERIFQKGKTATQIAVDLFECSTPAVDLRIAQIKQFSIQMTSSRSILLGLGLGLGWITLVLALFFEHLIYTLRALLSYYT